MTQLHDPRLPLVEVPQPKKTPQMVASAVGAIVLSFVQIVLYAILAVAACGVGWISLRVIIWACQLAGSALGLGR